MKLSFTFPPPPEDFIDYCGFANFDEYSFNCEKYSSVENELKYEEYLKFGEVLILR